MYHGKRRNEGKREREIIAELVELWVVRDNDGSFSVSQW